MSKCRGGQDSAAYRSAFAGHVMTPVYSWNIRQAAEQEATCAGARGQGADWVL